jgi:hypothetical protein
MRRVRLLFTRSYWKSGFSIKALLAGMLAAFGALYVFAKVVALVAPELQVEIARLPSWVRWSVLMVYVAGSGLWAVWPRSRVECKLAGRDVLLAIEVGDLFDTSHALVISTNRTFDTMIGDNCISSTSAQGQFTHRYYRDSTYLDTDIAQSLDGVPFHVNEQKTLGKTKEYPIGTVAMVRPSLENGTRRRAYLLAIAQMNNHGRASGTLEELLAAIGELWAYVGLRGDIEPVRVPVLGTGYSRLTEQRSEIIREILKSFIAACSERRFCDHLTIVISYADYRQYNIDLEELGRYLTHVCKYAELKRPSDRGGGLPIAAAG